MLNAIDPAAPTRADRADVQYADAAWHRFSAERRPAQCRERRILGEYVSLMRRVTLDDARKLMRYGVPIQAITLVCPAPARIALDRSGERYWLDDAGWSAWVLPVCCADHEDPESLEVPDPLTVVSTGAVIDLLAFHPDYPRRWPFRLGNAAVLGAIEPQYLDPGPATVHRDVTDWLRSGCGGIVLLTRDPVETGRILRQGAAIEAEDQVHAAELRRVLVPPPLRLPAVTVRPRCEAQT